MRRVPIEDSFDLHSFLPRDVPGALSDYLEEARKCGWREVRIIHGKGRGVRRAEVLRLLESNPLVLSYFEAPPDRGGFGSTIAILNS